MTRARKYCLLLTFCVIMSECQVDSGPQTSLSRRKRYVVFPEGSTFSIALCVTVHTLTPDDIFTEGINWGISYDLPNESKPALEPFLQLRHDKIKAASKYPGQKPSAINNKHGEVKYAGWNNNEKYYFKPGKKKYSKPDYYYLQRRHRRDLYNKLETIMNAFPLKRIFSFEPEEHRTYSEAHKAGHQGQDCAAMFPGCSFSLIDMALGKYDATRTRQPQLPLMSDETTDWIESSPERMRYNMK